MEYPASLQQTNPAGWNDIHEIWMEHLAGGRDGILGLEMQMEILDWNPEDFWPVIEIEFRV